MVWEMQGTIVPMSKIYIALLVRQGDPATSKKENAKQRDTVRMKLKEIGGKSIRKTVKERHRYIF